MAARFPAVLSRWQQVAGKWFPISGTNSTTSHVRYVVATQFIDVSGQPFDAIKDGLTTGNKTALDAKFPGVAKPVVESDFPQPLVPPNPGDDFTLPLVPEGTVVDLRLEPGQATATGKSPQGHRPTKRRSRKRSP
jgi:hypothetical protein